MKETIPASTDLNFLSSVLGNYEDLECAPKGIQENYLFLILII